MASVSSAYFFAKDLTVDRQGAIWFWASSNTDARVYRSLNGQLASFVVGARSLDVLPQADPALTTDDQGTAWLGVNQEIIHIGAAPDAVTRISLPPAVDNQVTERMRPPLVKGLHAIVGLADHGSSLAIISNASSEVQLYDTKAATFVPDLSLPSGYEPLSIGYFADGTLAVGLNSETTTHKPDTIALYPPGATTAKIVSVADSAALNPTGFGALFTGNEDPTIISADGTTSPLPPLPPGVTINGLLGGPRAFGPSGFTIATMTSIDSYDSKGTLQARASYPVVPCYPSSDPGGNPGSTGASGPSNPCTTMPIAIATSGDSALALNPGNASDGPTVVSAGGAALVSAGS